MRAAASIELRYSKISALVTSSSYALLACSGVYPHLFVLVSLVAFALWGIRNHKIRQAWQLMPGHAGANATTGAICSQAHFDLYRGCRYCSLYAFSAEILEAIS